MTKFNYYKNGLLLGLIPIIGLCILFFISWIGRAIFAIDIEVDGIGLLYIMLSVPIVLTGFIFTIVALFKAKPTKFYKPIIGLILIALNLPVLKGIVQSYGRFTSRAYLKIVNNSNKNFDKIVVYEPDNKKEFGNVKKQHNRIIFYDPDYGTYHGIEYAGISENFLVMTIQGQQIKKQIPIIQPGEIHQLSIDNKFNLTDIFINKIIFKNDTAKQ